MTEKQQTETPRATMKAALLLARGGPEQLVVQDTQVPGTDAGDALVRVHATGITPAELTWDETYEDPGGKSRVPSIPGHELSGVVESIAPDVTDLRPGDAVYGLADFSRNGAAAEYIAVRAANLAPKPRTLDHTQTAAVPLSALTAWQALFERAGVSAGQRVLIHGAAGGVGTFAVQLAHWRGAHVIATALTSNFGLLRELGANEIIDYTSQRFEDVAGEVDMVLDTIGGSTRERSWGLLRPGGILVTLPGPIPPEEAAKHGGRGLFFIVKPSRAQLIEIARLIDDGHLRPVLAAVLPLGRAREAFEQGMSGHNRGKIVLQVAEQRASAG